LRAVELILAGLCALAIATLAEYFIHRSMHWGFLYRHGHQRHHARNESRTFLHDFLDYGTGAALFGWVGFVVSIPAGAGTLLGAFVYAGLASYAHQLHHANADLVWWMQQPVHRLHHAHDMTAHNFGILVDWWDRIFGTYRPTEWQQSPSKGHLRLKNYIMIPWR
jgi:sterol desaturase/sphingolipid hydroxylase (fatty acid hydroxylase superfamily)